MLLDSSAPIRIRRTNYSRLVSMSLLSTRWSMTCCFPTQNERKEYPIDLKSLFDERVMIGSIMRWASETTWQIVRKKWRENKQYHGFSEVQWKLRKTNHYTYEGISENPYIGRGIPVWMGYSSLPASRHTGWQRHANDKDTHRKEIAPYVHEKVSL